MQKIQKTKKLETKQRKDQDFREVGEDGGNYKG